MEGGVFPCSWKKQRKVYKVWVKKRPRLSAQGRTFSQADKRLWSVIIHATGDGESIREYDPPAPDSEPEVEPAQLAAADTSTWSERLASHAIRKRRKSEPLKTNAKIQRQFASRVNEHFAFLRELGFSKPRFTSKFDPDTGMSWKARFGSKRRTLDIVLSKAYKDYSNSAAFEINPRPVEDSWEAFMGFMYLRMKYLQLSEIIDEIELTHTLDEIMELEFPFYADLFRGELRPLLTGAKWHDGYKFYRDD